MPDEDHVSFIAQLFRLLLKRSATEAEMSGWIERLKSGESSEIDAYRRVANSWECKRKNEIIPFFYDGQYASPVVDPRTVDAYLNKSRSLEPQCIPSLEESIPGMRDFWNDNLELIKNTPFAESDGPIHRYHYANGSYPHGDAIILRAMMFNLKPKKIIEIGSGFSTACMLDAADQAKLSDLHITCIEPYPDRLRSRLRTEDESRVTIYEKPVQEVPVEYFHSLNSGDILFIDSSHVLKTGSDVHYELFHILPALRSGVFIHIHDVPYPFEYNDVFIKERNYSWNEAYAVRAFVMHNNAYEIVLWSNLLALKYRDVIKNTFPIFLRNTGSSLWLRKL
jgi:predicted O-methyltransferase YrrM